MMKIALYLTTILLLILPACGPAGPVLGLGPTLDPPAALILLIALVFGGFWVVKSAFQSPSGQAIERRIVETGQSVLDQFRSPSRNAGEQGEAPSRSEEILKERYARGEIDRTQYLEMLNDVRRR